MLSVLLFRRTIFKNNIMRNTTFPFNFTYVKTIFFALVGTSNTESYQAGPVNPNIKKLKLPQSFRVEHLYSPAENEQGSWVVVTYDDKNRLITSDQYGALLSSGAVRCRIRLPESGYGEVDNRRRNRIGYQQKPTEEWSAIRECYGHLIACKKSDFFKIQ